MPLPPPTDEQCAMVSKLYKETGNYAEVARITGIPRTTVQDWCALAEDRELDVFGQASSHYDPPELASSEMPVDDIIAAKIKRFERLQRADDSARWMKFRVQADGPFCLAFIGDPHLDDDGCNMPRLVSDVELIQRTDCCWSVGMGDYTNNWSGRLQRLYADQATTRSEGWALAEWFFGLRKNNGQSMHWLLIKGNHDLWASSHGNGDPLDWMRRGTSVMKDWQARFVAESPNGSQVRIHASHNFKGHSQWNTLHGSGKAAKWQEEADLYIDADKHNWALRQEEDQHRPGRVYWTARCRGYKFIDKYSDQLGFSSQEHGATISMVVDPDGQGPSRMKCFSDLEEAVDFLAFKRRAL